MEGKGTIIGEDYDNGGRGVSSFQGKEIYLS